MFLFGVQVISFSFFLLLLCSKFNNSFLLSLVFPKLFILICLHFGIFNFNLLLSLSLFNILILLLFSFLLSSFWTEVRLLVFLLSFSFSSFWIFFIFLNLNIGICECCRIIFFFNFFISISCTFLDFFICLILVEVIEVLTFIESLLYLIIIGEFFLLILKLKINLVLELSFFSSVFNKLSLFVFTE